jgi:hypothetical protein
MYLVRRWFRPRAVQHWKDGSGAHHVLFDDGRIERYNTLTQEWEIVCYGSKR